MKIPKQKTTKIPIIILNGFLGSGKTTLFKKLLAQSKKKNIPVCAIVNDMSELDVDGELIANTTAVEDNELIFESIHSCILSSNKGLKKLKQALDKLLSNQQPDLIIIETSGSCHPMPLIEFFKTQNSLKLTGVLALVDSLMLAHDYDYGQKLIPLLQNNLRHHKRDMINLLVEQILFCSNLVVTKTDRIKQEKLTDIVRHVQSINPYIPITSVVFGNLSIDEILELPEYDFYRVDKLIQELKPVLELESDGDRPYNMATRIIRDDRPFHPQRLWDICHQYLDQRIYRSKGFFWLSSRNNMSLLWNQAGGSINLELIGYWRSAILDDENNKLLDDEKTLLKAQIDKDSGRFGDRHCHLTVIGDKAKVDRFTEALKTCFLTEDEILYWEMGVEFDDPWPKQIVKM